MCINCDNNKPIYTYTCIGCIVRECLTLPKVQRLDYMTYASYRGRHKLDDVKNAVTDKFKRKV